MTKKGFTKFDIDLSYGQIREDKVKEMFEKGELKKLFETKKII